MKKKGTYVLLGVLTLALLSFFVLSKLTKESKAKYWHTQRKGANGFNNCLSEKWLTSAKKVGIEFARLAPGKDSRRRFSPSKEKA